MSLFDKKQQLNQGKIMEKPEKIIPKEEKKSPSVFEKKGYINPEEARMLLEKDKDRLFQRYSIKGGEVEGLAQKITDYKKFGSLTREKDIGKYEKLRKKEIEKIKNLDERAGEKRKLEKEMKIFKDVFLGEK